MPMRPIDELEVGMVLGEPVLGPNGNVLIGSGIELTPALITSLRSRGVEEVSVQASEQSDAEVEIPEEVLASAAEELAPRFRHSNLQHPQVKYLFEYATRERALELLRGSTGNS